MCLEPGRPFEWDARGKYMVVIDVYVNIDKLDRKVGEGSLKHSTPMGLITTWDQPVDLV